MKLTRGLAIALGLLAPLYCASSVAAGILKLSRTDMTIMPGETPGELWAENKGDTPLYLDVTQQWVANPGAMPEQLTPVGDLPTPELLVSPARLTLSPGQKYRMVIKVFGTPAKTKVWRLTFRPRENIVVDATDTQGRPTPLVVSIGYGVVIYQRAAMLPS